MIRDRRKQILLSDEERFRLWFGPYETPDVEIDDWVECEIHGRVRVTSWWQQGHIVWPCAGGRPKCGLQGVARPIVFEGLAHAVHNESSLAVQYWWGVSVATVQRWRKTLGVGHYNEGTKRLYRAFTAQLLTPEVTAEAVRLAATPEARRKAVETLHSFRESNGTTPPWTQDEEKLLGTASDRDIAVQLGRSLNSVELRRKSLGINSYSVRGQKTRAAWIRKKLGESVPVCGNEVRAARLNATLSLEEVAQCSGVSKQHLEEVEQSSVTLVSRSHFDALVRVLECQVDTLIEPKFLNNLMALNRER